MNQLKKKTLKFSLPKQLIINPNSNQTKVKWEKKNKKKQTNKNRQLVIKNWNT